MKEVVLNYLDLIKYLNPELNNPFVNFYVGSMALILIVLILIDKFEENSNNKIFKAIVIAITVFAGLEIALGAVLVLIWIIFFSVALMFSWIQN
jgi:hypothetical protein